MRLTLPGGGGSSSPSPNSRKFGGLGGVVLDKIETENKVPLGSIISLSERRSKAGDFRPLSFNPGSSAFDEIRDFEATKKKKSAAGALSTATASNLGTRLTPGSASTATAPNLGS